MPTTDRTKKEVHLAAMSQILREWDVVDSDDHKLANLLAAYVADQCALSRKEGAEELAYNLVGADHRHRHAEGA